MKATTLMLALVFIAQSSVVAAQQSTETLIEHQVPPAKAYTETLFADFESDFQNQLMKYSQQLQLDIEGQVKQSITNLDLSILN
ncbi:hypothetical protein GCM10010919_00580 [Alishewanella longhuensis]|uniref:Uncharacterized protein n=1 Tax=Alishewanella longhuensis TaxID=1091037 RepID=A0ABQ3KVN7_9ALTE|nr:hypothetical protein [Alishewanella longhuensis]GHG58680.1 hypothetical protein GCM10010919_00580 [Alishewanella longhuensis]